MSLSKERLEELIIEKKLSSPSYVFDQKVFRNRATLVKDALGEDIDICFSIKANPFLVSHLPGEFSKVEVCSPGELFICKKNNLPSEKIIFSGVNKTREDIFNACDYGVELFTGESLKQVEDINEAGESAGRVLPLILRLSDESQFGIDEEELISIIKRREEYPGVKIRGIHYFTGTDKRKPKEIQREMNRLTKVFKRLEEEAYFTPDILEYGTGLGVDYFPSSEAQPEETERNLLEETAEILKTFNNEMKSYNKEFHMTVEMGRFFAASCGLYITRIMDKKTNDGTNYLILDGGLHQLKYHGQLQGMKIPMVTHISLDSNKRNDEAATVTATGTVSGTSAETAKEMEVSAPWTICGSLCTTADVLTRNVILDSPNIGDYLVFHQVGAYSVTEGISLFLSRDLPAVYHYTEEGVLNKLRDSIETAYLNTES